MPENEIDSDAFNHKLIDKVSQQRQLYDTCHYGKKNRALVDATWIEIANDLSSTGIYDVFIYIYKICLHVLNFFTYEWFLSQKNDYCSFQKPYITFL